jgi:hypothetical protein
VNSVKLEVHFLLTDSQKDWHVDWCQDSDYLDPDVKTQLLITDYIREFPPVVLVDGAVWHSVDKHSRDRYVVKLVMDPCQLDDDQLEDLADTEDVVNTLASLFASGQDWKMDMFPLI